MDEDGVRAWRDKPHLKLCHFGGVYVDMDCEGVTAYEGLLDGGGSRRSRGGGGGGVHYRRKGTLGGRQVRRRGGVCRIILGDGPATSRRRAGHLLQIRLKAAGHRLEGVPARSEERRAKSEARS